MIQSVISDVDPVVAPEVLKWDGCAHDPSSAAGTKSGELAVICPSCPHPGINLPEGWEEAPIGMRFVMQSRPVIAVLTYVGFFTCCSWR